MKEPTNKQIKEFWEWCGWVNEITRTPPLNIFGGDDIYNWTRPDKVIHYKELPPVDLNNLFKYAVPKLRKKGCLFTHEFRLEPTRFTGLFVVAIWRSGEEWMVCKTDEDPALALFWALWEVMKDGEE